MNLRRFTIVLIGLAFLGTGFWYSAPLKSGRNIETVAKKKKNTVRRKRERTMYALQANQILLLTDKKLVSSR